MKVYVERRYIYTIFYVGTRWRRVVSFTNRLIYPRVGPGVSLDAVSAPQLFSIKRVIRGVLCLESD
jgi:hypothetical protein